MMSCAVAQQFLDIWSMWHMEVSFSALCVGREGKHFRSPPHQENGEKNPLSPSVAAAAVEVVKNHEYSNISPPPRTHTVLSLIKVEEKSFSFFLANFSPFRRRKKKREKYV